MYNNPDYAIKWGRTVEMGVDPSNKCFPFIYNFVDAFDDNWDAVKGSGTAANLTGIGPLVAAGTTVRHYIKLDYDYNFLVQWFRYTVYTPQTLVIAEYRWYENIAGWFQEQGDYQTAIGTPLVNFIDISVSFEGPDGRFIYGGKNINAIVNQGSSLLPQPVEDLQGYDFGYGQLKTPYFLPSQAAIRFDITNTHDTQDLYVGGMVHGLKVKL